MKSRKAEYNIRSRVQTLEQAKVETRETYKVKRRWSKLRGERRETGARVEVPGTSVTEAGREFRYMTDSDL